jgi:DNA polymerase III subunit epsilon
VNVWGKLFGRKKTATRVGDGPHLPSRPPPPPPPAGDRRFTTSQEHASVAAGCFASVVGEADRIVVVDTETTGVFASDRVVEVALVTLDLDGRIIDEFDTLIDPQRDVGPTWIHGISASMLAGAPTFEDVCGQLAVRLHGAVVAAHNLPFDSRMLAGEYARLGLEVHLSAGLDTLAMTRARLEAACSTYGLRLDGAHAALADARATAQLLVALADRCDGFTCLPAVLPAGLKPQGRVRRRDGQPSVSAAAPYLAQLTARLHHPERDAKIAAYLDLLDRAMADLHLDGDERTQLRELARQLGLGAGEIDQAHRRWLGELVATACSDGEVTAEQYDELCRAAAVLGIGQRVVDDRTATFRSVGLAVRLQPGMTVCFTGVPVDRDGRELSRELLVAHARRLGLEPVDSVTKSRCQLLIAADVASRSGKANKARRFDIPIVNALDFLAATLGGQVQAVATGVPQRETNVCQQCEQAWTRLVARGKKPELCPGCESGSEMTSMLQPAMPARTSTAPELKEPTVPETGRHPGNLVVAVDEDAGVETLICTTCGVRWQRERVRGRKPRTCLDCR